MVKVSSSYGGGAAEGKVESHLAMHDAGFNKLDDAVASI